MTTARLRGNIDYKLPAPHASLDLALPKQKVREVSLHVTAQQTPLALVVTGNLEEKK